MRNREANTGGSVNISSAVVHWCGYTTLFLEVMNWPHCEAEREKQKSDGLLWCQCFLLGRGQVLQYAGNIAQRLFNL